MADTATRKCSFCSRQRGKVHYLLGRSETFICERCIESFLDELQREGLDLVKKRAFQLLDKQAPPSSPRVHCSFCKKSQDDVRWVVAGPEVFICDECIDICIEIMVERYPNFIRNRWVQVDEEPNQSERVVTLPGEYYHVGLGLIAHFAVALRAHAPSLDAQVQLQLEGRTVRLRIRHPEADKPRIEWILDQYGRIIQGLASPRELLAQADQVTEFEERLRLMELELQRITELRAAQAASEVGTSPATRVARLREALGWIFRRELEDIEELLAPDIV